MTTIVTFKTVGVETGTPVVFEDSYPSISPEDNEMCLCDPDCGVREIIALDQVARVEFQP